MKGLPRFFVEPARVAGGIVILVGGDVHHLRSVLRLRPGDEIAVADGLGTDYRVRLTRIERSEAEGAVVAQNASAGEPSLAVTLFTGLSKGERMEYTIQKATEIGVTAIVPVITERSVKAPAAERFSGRLERWRRIAAEAAKQSGRGRVPAVAEPVHWEAAINERGASLPASASLPEPPPSPPLLIPWEEAGGPRLKEALRAMAPVRSLGIAVGPEGGLTADEVALGVSRGAVAVTLGPRILRTETAGPVAAALCLYELGDLG